MTVVLNDSVAGVPSGGGTGGGASASEVANAVVALLPPPPTASAVATAVVSALPPSTKAGEVREFAVGAVPAGFAQVSGPAIQADSAMFAALNMSAKLGASSSNVVAAAGRLVAAYVSGSSWLMQELAADYTRLNSPTTIPSLNTSYTCRLIPLEDGRVLRVGADASATSSGITQVYNPATGAISARASKPSANISPQAARAAQAGNGLVYGAFVPATTEVSAYDVAANTWYENIAQAPATAANTVSIAKLPSGKLFWCTVSAQFVFDPATLQFSQVGSLAGAGGAAVETSRGVRLYYVAESSVVFHEYDEATNTFTTVTSDAPRIASPTTVSEPASGYRATLNPHTGAVLIKSVSGNKSDVAYQHLLSYQPVGAVKAVKL